VVSFSSILADHSNVVIGRINQKRKQQVDKASSSQEANILELE
jgi:hypothetical protein